MAIDFLADGSSSTSTQSFTYLVDYDTVAQTIGLTCTGTGHARLDVKRVSDQVSLGAAWADQFAASTGTIRQAETIIDGVGQEDAGQSDGPVSYSGQRTIILGPAASGIDVHGKPLPTAAVPASVVGTFHPPKNGGLATLDIELHWNPLP